MQKNTRKRSNRDREESLRGWADILKLWAACDNAACVRAGACRGAIRACAPKNFARAPEGVQGFFCCLVVAQEEGLNWDQAIEGYAGSRCERAMNAWYAEAEARRGIAARD